FEHHRCSRYADGKRAAANTRAAGTLWHPQEDGAAFDTYVPTILIERENAVSAHTGNGQISEGKFGARITAGVDGASIGDNLVQVCRTAATCGANSLTSRTT